MRDRAAGQLIRRFRRGEPEAAQQLLAEHGDALYATAYRLTGDRDTARDVVQESLIRVLRSGDGYRGGDLGAWLRTITVRTGLNLLTAERRRWRRGDEYEPPPTAGDGPGDPLLRDLLVAEIAALPEGQREVFVLIELEQWTHDEVAEALGVSAEASRQRLLRGRRQLQERLRHLRPDGRTEPGDD